MGMEWLKFLLIAAVVVFICLLLKTRLWRKIPVVSSIVSILLLIGGGALALFFGSILLFVILGVIGILIALFFVFWIFGKARFYRLSKENLTISSEEMQKPKKKPKVKVVK